MKRRAHVLHNLLAGCVQRKDYHVLAQHLPEKHEYIISGNIFDSLENSCLLLVNQLFPSEQFQALDNC